ncbi:MAG: dethiobiotin synthase [Acidobacteria bacterium]|nr:dethiobiotin synthase [Acidobacteriota bacterium]
MIAGFFVTGTGTGVGKTVLSALLTVALDGFYWKPIQAGRHPETDRERVLRWTRLPQERVLPEVYLLRAPLSPHLAAEREGLRIALAQIRRPLLSRPVIAEGAGGLLVPLNERSMMIDLIRRLGLPAIVAARDELGTINHTLLSLEALRARQIPLRGVVLIGRAHPEHRRAIEKYGRAQVIGHIPRLRRFHPRAFRRVYAREFDDLGAGEGKP